MKVARTPPGSGCVAGWALCWITHPFPTLSRDGKKKGGKARRGYSCSIREIGSASKQLPQGGRITSKSWEHKSLCSECLSVSPDGESQAPLPTPSSAADLQWELEPWRYLERHIYRKSPRAEGSGGGNPVGPLELLEASYSCSRLASILSFSQSYPGPSELPYFLHLLFFLFSICHCWLTSMEIIMVLAHGTCITGFAESPQGWAGKSLVCLAPKLLLFLSCHKREGLHVLMAEMETLHLSQNSLHMDLLKGCFYIPLQKSALSLCWWVMPWSRSHCCQLGVTPLKPEYKMQLLATFTYSTPYSIICPSFLSTECHRRNFITEHKFCQVHSASFAGGC